MTDTLDLDALVSALDVSPLPVTLNGTTYQVRRDLTGPEIAKYWVHVRAGEDAQALSLVVGDEHGKALNEALDQLPQKHMVAVTRKIMEVAGLISEGEAGE